MHVPHTSFQSERLPATRASGNATVVALARVHYKRVIPCMDVDAGRVVKGTRFLDIRDAGDPVELAAFYDREGADELIFLDITATSDKRATVVELARRAADEVFVPFTIGGGVREVADAQAVLDAGADKVVGQLRRGRAAGAGRRARGRVRRPVRRAGDRRQARAAHGWEVFVAGGRTPTGRDAVAWAREGVERGAGEILLTSMDRDGTQDGYDLELTRAIADAVDVPVIASGGVGAPRAHGRRLRRRRRRGARRVDLPLRPVLRRRGQGARSPRPACPCAASGAAARALLDAVAVGAADPALAAAVRLLAPA